MKIIAILPIKSIDNSKTRLSSIMSMNDRKELFKLFLRGTVNTVSNSNKIKEIIIVSSDMFTYKLAKDNNLKIISEEKDEGVNSAVKKG